MSVRGERETGTLNSLTHFISPDGTIKRRERKPVKTRRKSSPMPKKWATKWGQIFPDKREVCGDSAAGKAEYKRRTLEMAERQNWICAYCGTGMFKAPGYRYSVTFEHVNGRGAGKRDDRIEIDGKPYNLAVCWHCNGEHGSPAREPKQQLTR